MALFYPGHLLGCHRVVLHSCNEFLVMSKPKPRGCGVDAGVLDEMVDTAESILRDYRHGFERVDDEGECRDCGYRLYCG